MAQRASLPPRGPWPLSSAACRSQRWHQLSQAGQHPAGPRAPQDGASICQQPGDPGGRESTRWGLGRHPGVRARRAAAACSQGVLEVAEDAGLPGGLGCAEPVLFALQVRPWSQATVPAEGSGLLGKWPVGTRGVGSLACTPAASTPSRAQCSLRLSSGSPLCALWRDPGPAPPPTQRAWSAGAHIPAAPAGVGVAGGH